MRTLIFRLIQFHSAFFGEFYLNLVILLGELFSNQTNVYLKFHFPKTLMVRLVLRQNKEYRRIRSKICHLLICHFRYLEKKQHEILYISVCFFCFLLYTKTDFRRTNSLGRISFLDLPNHLVIFSFANLT